MRLLLRADVPAPQDTGHGRATGAATAKTGAALAMVAAADFAAESCDALVMVAAAAAIGGRTARSRRRWKLLIRVPILPSSFAVAALRTMPPLLDGDVMIVVAASLPLVRRLRASAPARRRSTARRRDLLLMPMLLRRWVHAFAPPRRWPTDRRRNLHLMLLLLMLLPRRLLLLRSTRRKIPLLLMMMRRSSLPWTLWVMLLLLHATLHRTFLMTILLLLLLQSTLGASLVEQRLLLRQ